MINIEERKTQKIPGLSSLFISFDYDAYLVEVLKNLEIKNYDKKTKEWEIPVTCLNQFLLNTCDTYETNIKLLEEETKEEKSFELLPYKTKSFKHQEEAVQFGLNHDRWLLLDAPGLGKSKAMINLAEELKIRNNIEHCLVICGINTLKSNWVKEIGIHSNLSCKILGQRITKKGKINFGGIKERLEDLKKPIEEFFVITNIETLRDENIIKAINSNINKFDLLLFDECHTAKSPTAEQTKGLMKIKQGQYRVGMTGTLILNNPLDTFVPLKFIGIENSTFTNFKYYYCKFSGPFNNIPNGFKNTDVLKNELEKYSLRRTKDLLDLPEKIVIDEELDMDTAQKNFYDNIKQGIVDQVDKVHMSTANLLAMVARLRQATACPTFLTSENINSVKVDRACELVEEIVSNGSKVVLFNTFKETAKNLMERLKEYNPLLCTGDQSDLENSNNVDLFQNNPTYKVMIATWQKMGTGITLTAANYMIFTDTPWTYGVYEQAQDRIHRIGTKNTVFIYNLICKDTIDERVKQLVETKRAISDYMIDNDTDAFTINCLKQYIQELQ